MASNQPEKLRGNGNFMEQKAVLQQGEATGTQIPSAKFLD